MGEYEAGYAGGTGRFTGLGGGRVAHGVRLFGGALWSVGIVDEQVRTSRPLDDLPARTGIYGEDDGCRPGYAKTHAFEVMVQQEWRNLRLPHLDGFAGNKLVPAEPLAQPVFHTRDSQPEKTPQRAKRLGCGVDRQRGFRDGCEGGEKGSHPPDVVEMVVADEQVTHGFERDARIGEAPQYHGATGGIEQHRLVGSKRQSQAGLGPLRVERVTGSEKDQTSHPASPRRGYPPWAGESPGRRQ